MLIIASNNHRWLSSLSSIKYIQYTRRRGHERRFSTKCATLQQKGRFKIFICLQCNRKNNLLDRRRANEFTFHSNTLFIWIEKILIWIKCIHIWIEQIFIQSISAKYISYFPGWFIVDKKKKKLKRNSKNSERDPEADPAIVADSRSGYEISPA